MKFCRNFLVMGMGVALAGSAFAAPSIRLVEQRLPSRIVQAVDRNYEFGRGELD